MRVSVLKQLEHHELALLRATLHEEQGNVCPILGEKFKVQDMVVDHKHRRSNATIGKDEGGLIRGVIHRQVNAFEGKVSKNFIRCGLHQFNKSLPDVLRALADYYERGALNYIHPNEKPKCTKVLGKRLYAKIAKAYKEKYPKRKPLEYPVYLGRPEKKPLLKGKWLELIKELKIEV